MVDVARKIDNLRYKKGWSFYKLSLATGITKQAFANWIAGKSVPSLPALEAVCDAFGITLANLFAEEGMVEVTPELKPILDNWTLLSKTEQESIKLIIENYMNNKQTK